MSLLFVNSADETPIYRQIVLQVIEALASGALRPGNRLPSHRELSKELVIAPMTVKKAYDELEAAGYIETLRGQGTFVRAHPPEGDRSLARERVRKAARHLLNEARVAGLRRDEVHTLLDEEEKRVETERTPNALNRKEKQPCLR